MWNRVRSAVQIQLNQVSSGCVCYKLLLGQVRLIPVLRLFIQLDEHLNRLYITRACVCVGEKLSGLPRNIEQWKIPTTCRFIFWRLIIRFKRFELKSKASLIIVIDFIVTIRLTSVTPISQSCRYNKHATSGLRNPSDITARVGRLLPNNNYNDRSNHLWR